MNEFNPYEVLNTVILTLFISGLTWTIISNVLARKKQKKNILVSTSIREAIHVPVGGIRPPFCRLKEKHVHARITMTISINNEEHEITFYYCPLTRRIYIISPHPLTPDQVKHGEDYEEQSNHYGE